MSEYDATADECDHENIHYHDMDVGEPGVVYENWHCLDCGAGVIKVYEPQRRIIDPRNGDSYTEEVDA